MPYCNYLYNVSNIIGYTGNLNNDPTVYFQLGRAYGHITQNHRLPFNIGREKVAIHKGYHIDNYYINGELHAIEWEGSKDIHTSRNAFVRRQFFAPGDLLTLSVALYRFPDLKLVYVASHRQMQAKERVKAELLSQFDKVRNHRLELFYTGVDKNPNVTRIIEANNLGE